MFLKRKIYENGYSDGVRGACEIELAQRLWEFVVEKHSYRILSPELTKIQFKKVLWREIEPGFPLIARRDPLDVMMAISGFIIQNSLQDGACTGKELRGAV